jgi:hydroxymethylglutaryl-CoA lyase
MRIAESPREAFQSFHQSIPTDRKIEYINQLLKVGFDTIEAGSIVSTRLVPQLADTPEVIRGIDLSESRSGIMVLVGSRKGASVACGLSQVSRLSYPFSISASFLKQNLNITTGESISDVAWITDLCARTGKEPVIYISMAFGNPYGDDWNLDLLLQAVRTLTDLGVRIIPLSNVAIEIGPDLIKKVFSLLIPSFPGIEFGLHLHTSGKDVEQKIRAAWESGCRRFDTVTGGYGGCPMSGTEMLGNLDSEDLIRFALSGSVPVSLNRDPLLEAARLSKTIFSPLQ